MDDLLEVIDFKTAIMKMDIQAMEHKAFVHAEKLLDSISIPFIFMEFMELVNYYKSKTHQSADKIMVRKMIDLLQSKGYVPVNKLGRGPRLDPNRWNTWPGDMSWVKKLKKTS